MPEVSCNQCADQHVCCRCHDFNISNSHCAFDTYLLQEYPLTISSVLITDFQCKKNLLSWSNTQQYNVGAQKIEKSSIYDNLIKSTVQYRYNADIFFQNPPNRYPIARPCITLINILLQSLLCCVQYHKILNRDISAPDSIICVCLHIFNSSYWYIITLIIYFELHSYAKYISVESSTYCTTNY